MCKTCAKRDKFIIFDTLKLQCINILTITTKRTQCPRGEIGRHKELKRYQLLIFKTHHVGVCLFMKKILIMGLPGSGKSYLAKKLSSSLNAVWLNADALRKKEKDWDFSLEGRKRQAFRMLDLAKKEIKKNRIIVADFVCPLDVTRKIFKPDLLIWMDTIKKSRFKDTNKIFIPPSKFDFRIKEKNADLYNLMISDRIKKYKWNEKKPTAQMLGRFQPWHDGHKKLFETILLRVKQINIQVKNVQGVGDNPFKFLSIKKMINKSLKNYSTRYKITLVPNISNIFYGRTVGYKIEKINLNKSIQKISATKIRKKLRLNGKLKQKND